MEPPIRVISPEVAAFFEAENLMSLPARGKRLISTSALSTPSATGTASPSLAADAPQEAVNDIEIPENLNSLETYAFIGFNNATAAKLWNIFCATPQDSPDDFMDHARFQIEKTGVEDATCLSDDWVGVMDALGINNTLQPAILLPEFSDLRSTASCKFWLLDTMEASYATLRGLNDNLRMKQAIRQRAKVVLERRDSISGRSPPPGIGADYTSSMAASIEPTPTVTFAGEAPLTLDNHRMIWRGCTKIAAEEFCGTDSTPLKMGAVSTLPGDFSGERKVAYWSPQKETADRYAQWLKHKLPISEIAIVQVAVPEDMIRHLSVNYLWSDGSAEESDTWRKVVWYSRRGEELPGDICHLESKDLWIGHIASGKHVKYENMKDHNQIKPSDVLTVEIDGAWRKAIQWVFYTRSARDKFCESCAGKVWIRPFGPLVSQKCA
ncbi:hypothetical protein FQN55_000865 [Onygenales sp. PD_40]|nr:hypothetical protein FQN55_000865 [Onygenales sp. PD_40]